MLNHFFKVCRVIKMFYIFKTLESVFFKVIIICSSQFAHLLSFCRTRTSLGLRALLCPLLKNPGFFVKKLCDSMKIHFMVDISLQNARRISDGKPEPSRTHASFVACYYKPPRFGLPEGPNCCEDNKIMEGSARRQELTRSNRRISMDLPNALLLICQKCVG